MPLTPVLYDTAWMAIYHSHVFPQNECPQAEEWMDHDGTRNWSSLVQVLNSVNRQTFFPGLFCWVSEAHTSWYLILTIRTVCVYVWVGGCNFSIKKMSGAIFMRLDLWKTLTDECQCWAQCYTYLQVLSGTLQQQWSLPTPRDDQMLSNTSRTVPILVKSSRWPAR